MAKTFDEWWKEYWTPTKQPQIFDKAMKEIAQNAWEAAFISKKDRVLIFDRFTFLFFEKIGKNDVVKYFPSRIKEKFEEAIQETRKTGEKNETKRSRIKK